MNSSLRGDPKGPPRESNSPPLDYESSAPPSELRGLWSAPPSPLAPAYRTSRRRFGCSTASRLPFIKASGAQTLPARVELASFQLRLTRLEGEAGTGAIKRAMRDLNPRPLG